MPKRLQQGYSEHWRSNGLLPKEGGIIGIWFSSLLYGILALKAHNIDLPVMLALIGAIFTLPATSIVLRKQSIAEKLPVIGVASLLFIPLIIVRFPASTFYLTATITLLIGALLANGLSLILIGGPLVSATGGVLALSTENPVAALLPLTYTLMTVVIAGARVTGRYKDLSITATLGGLGIIIATLVLYSDCPLIRALLIVDVLVRLSLIPTGAYDKLSLKQYGFHEFLRSTFILGLAGWCL